MKLTPASTGKVDLTAFYTGTLDAPFFPVFTPGDADNDLSELPTGTVRLADVWFDLRGVIQLRRKETRGSLWQFNWERYPEAVVGIPLARPLRRLHVLHGATAAAADSEVIGELRFHYADGSQAELDVLYGRHLLSWWTKPPAQDDLPEARLAWSGSNPAAEDEGAQLQLYRVAFDNPQPDLPVMTIDLVSRMSGSAWFVIAITAD